MKTTNEIERPDVSHDADCAYRHKGECTCGKDSRTAHTPGLWAVAINEDSQTVHITANNGDTQLALMCATDTMEQVLPDAHLLASAPEMIHVLELVAREHKAKGRVCTCENLPYPCTPCAVNAAISNSKPA